MERYQYSQQEQAILEGLQQPFAVYQYLDRRVYPILLSQGFCDLFGYTDMAQAYRDMEHDLYKDVHPDDIARIANVAFRFATEDEPYEVIYRANAKGRSGYTVIHAIGKHVCTQSGVRLAQVWYTDEGSYTNEGQAARSELNRALSGALHEESILKANRYDYLTGLPSMTYFFELAEMGKERIRSGGGRTVFLYMDLNGMKVFNHKYSFAEGDRLLQAFAKLLARTFSSENCCHIGADRFAVFTEEDGLEDTLTRLFREVKSINGGNSLPIRLGIYQTALEDVPISVAYDRAKIACDAIRKGYESSFNYYSSALRDSVKKRQYILSNLDRALSEHWVRVYYQPIIRAITGKVCDEEALARWIDPTNGFMSPADFIPVLEDAGLLYKLDLYVLEQVLDKIRRQQMTGLYVVPHSINLSRSDFDACDIVEEIRRRVDEAGVCRDKITIEITESTVGTDFAFMREQVLRFQALGFPVWMDDFGSGYSSLDVLQSIKFNLLKFDMSFMRKLDEGENGKIILTELVKMATALGVDTVCEGVETEAQVHFLQEIGCSKLQGFYYCKAIPLEEIIERNRKGIQIGYENPEESAYNESIGRVNLYDLAVIANEDENTLQNTFNTLPMGIIEVRGEMARFVRSNQSYRDFVRRFFSLDLSQLGAEFARYGSSFMNNVVKTCCELGIRSFYDEKMPDGSVVHSFARRIGINPVNGTIAVAVAVLSISEANDRTSYADIARALAADYYNIYVVDLDTEHFIEYSSPVGGEDLAMERHGTDFFAEARRDTMSRLYEGDRDVFLELFTRENVIRELDSHGVFTAAYRLIDTGDPMYVNLKATRMQAHGNSIIIGISIVDSQIRQRELFDRVQREEAAYARVSALSGDYLSLYTIDPVSGRYLEYSATDDYRSLGFARKGADFFLQGVIDGKCAVCPEDLPQYLERFTRGSILREIRETGAFQLRYRLVIRGEARPVVLKIVSVQEQDGEKLIAGVRVWHERH